MILTLKQFQVLELHTFENTQNSVYRLMIFRQLHFVVTNLKTGIFILLYVTLRMVLCFKSCTLEGFFKIIYFKVFIKLNFKYSCLFTLLLERQHSLCNSHCSSVLRTIYRECFFNSFFLKFIFILYVFVCLLHMC